MMGIYVLIDPRDRQVRYIGQSINVERRRFHHRGTPEKERREPLSNWIRKLRRVGLRPMLIPVVKCSSIEELDAYEKAWIRSFRERGCDLLNVLDGGNDFRNAYHPPHTEEWRAQARLRVPWNKGRSMTADARDRMRRAALGRRLKPETIAKIRVKLTGRPVSEETRQKLRIKSTEASTGSRPEVRAKISATLRGRRASDETKRKLVEAQQRRRAQERAVKKLEE